MESSPEDAAETAGAQSSKEASQESTTSGEGAASALTRLRTIEEAQAATGLNALGADEGQAPS